ncbi:MAG: hypothetical protein ABR503_02025 [Chitinophagaceae bacterium]
MMDHFFQPFPSILKNDFGDVFRQTPPMNIKESEKAYLLEIVAPGFEKEDFKINLEKRTVNYFNRQEKEN